MRKSSCLFLLLFSLAVNVFAANEDNNGWSKDAEKCSLYMIGHAHIDPVWLWPWSEGMAVVHSTFRSALDRMNENPDYVFSCSSAQFYEWVAVNDPEMMKEIKKREKEGRWELVGGWWVEPDVHMASGEALVRHGLYGQASFKKLFGKTVSVGLNADTFGHTASLPQILQKQGITNYTFLRPTPYEMDFPSEVFEWQGIDGTKILSCRIQDSYNIGHDLQRRIDKLASEHLLHPTDSLMIFYGVGDHGGELYQRNVEMD